METKVLIKKLIGSDCLKYKTNESDKNDNAKKGISIIKNKNNEIVIDENANEWLLINCIKRIYKINFTTPLIKG